MNDAECAAFLQQALPRMDLRWAGFRKVRRQVCRRLARRLAELGLADLAGYHARLEADPAERARFDAMCRITISRFHRDRGVFETLRREVLPLIAARAQAEGRAAQAWSAGCASGEEAYTVRVLWDLEVAPGADLFLLATDVDPAMIERARRACYEASSLRELDPALVEAAFEREGPAFRLKPAHRAGVEFAVQDLRAAMPERAFDLILCRYLAFTYFAEPLQRRVLAGLVQRLQPGGWLVVGTHERLPDTRDFEAWGPCVFKRVPSPLAGEGGARREATGG